MPYRSERANNNNNENATSFGNFFEGWLVRQEHYLDELLCTLRNRNDQREDELRGLIARILSHYQQYYEAKSIAAHEDVFLVFSPTWFSSFERTFLWIAGFKPSLAFQLVTSSIGDLSDEQLQMMDRLKAEIRTEERELTEEMARVQESVAAPPLLELARRAVRGVDREMREMDSVFETLRSSMEMLLESADFLRGTTAMKVIEMLSPVQSVRFLGVAAQLQLRVRTWGLQRDADWRRTTPFLD